jgi:hypothetical protein
MRAYDLYGIAGESLDAARDKVSDAIGIAFVAHESGYLGQYYRHRDVGEEHFILQSNFDSVEAEWTEPDRRDLPFLLYVNETSRSHELRRKLQSVGGIELLRHEEVG